MAFNVDFLTAWVDARLQRFAVEVASELAGRLGVDADVLAERVASQVLAGLGSLPQEVAAGLQAELTSFEQNLVPAIVASIKGLFGRPRGR